VNSRLSGRAFGCVAKQRRHLDLLANVFFFTFLLFPIIVLGHNIAEGPDRGKLGSKNALCFDESFQTSQALHRSLNYDEGLLTSVFINNSRLHIKPQIDENGVGRKKGCPTELAVRIVNGQTVAGECLVCQTPG
jgi:hypothetical protein